MVADIADRQLFVLLPFTPIWVARDRLSGSNLRWGAQDVHPDDGGAHTGDVSAPMLADLGCTYVEVGHHERRREYGETDELIAAKVAAAQRWGMTAIACVGEQRRVPFARAVEELDLQLRRLLACDLARLVIAYEPAWAIGVGSRPASPAWVGRAHAAIRARMSSAGAAGRTVPIIYGGSVGPAGASGLLAQRQVDGLFVGRQALDPTVFATIAHMPIRR